MNWSCLCAVTFPFQDFCKGCQWTEVIGIMAAVVQIILVLLSHSEQACAQVACLVFFLPVSDRSQAGWEPFVHTASPAHVLGFACGLRSAVKFILCLLSACAEEQRGAAGVCMFGGKELSQDAKVFWGVELGLGTLICLSLSLL